jgi:mRNA-binding protein PUF3
LLQNDNICLLAKDKEGHHMLEKIITSFAEEKRTYIFEDILFNFNELATDKQGLCVLKKLIEFTKDYSNQKKIIAKILENTLEYAQNAFGNFVVSEVLNQFKYETCIDIYSSIKGHYVQLSQNKFSSKFIEVCID